MMDLAHCEYLTERAEPFISGVVELAKKYEVPLVYAKFSLDEALGRIEQSIVIRDESIDAYELGSQAHSFKHGMARDS